jgi:hypothetical protein
VKAKEPIAAEQEDIESRTYTGILLGPRPIYFWGGYSFVLVMEETEGFFERVGNRKYLP